MSYFRDEEQGGPPNSDPKFNLPAAGEPQSADLMWDKTRSVGMAEKLEAEGIDWTDHPTSEWLEEARRELNSNGNGPLATELSGALLSTRIVARPAGRDQQLRTAKNIADQTKRENRGKVENSRGQLRKKKYPMSMILGVGLISAALLGGLGFMGFKLLQENAVKRQARQAAALAAQAPTPGINVSQVDANDPSTFIDPAPTVPKPKVANRAGGGTQGDAKDSTPTDDGSASSGNPPTAGDGSAPPDTQALTSEYERGQRDGKVAGFAGGQADGYASGKTDGVKEGRTQGVAQGQTAGQREGFAQGKAEGQAQGVAQGQTAGQREGFAQGKAEGQAQGKREGQTEGYSLGRAEGVAQAATNPAGGDSGQATGTGPVPVATSGGQTPGVVLSSPTGTAGAGGSQATAPAPVSKLTFKQPDGGQGAGQGQGVPKLSFSGTPPTQAGSAAGTPEQGARQGQGVPKLSFSGTPPTQAGSAAGTPEQRAPFALQQATPNTDGAASQANRETFASQFGQDGAGQGGSKPSSQSEQDGPSGPGGQRGAGTQRGSNLMFVQAGKGNAQSAGSTPESSTGQGGPDGSGGKLSFQTSPPPADSKASTPGTDGSGPAGNGPAGNGSPVAQASPSDKNKINYGPYNPYQTINAKLVTASMVLDDAKLNLEVVAMSADGRKWIGTPSISGPRRVFLTFSQVVDTDGVTLMQIPGAAYDASGIPGIQGKAQDQAPDLFRNLIRSAASGLSDYSKAALEQSKTSITPGGTVVVEKSAPNLWTAVGSRALSVLNLPTDQKTFYGATYLPSGTPIVIMVGAQGSAGQK